MFEIFSNHWEILFLGDFPHGAIGGLAMTLILSVLALGITFPAAVLIALVRTGTSKWPRKFAVGYVYLIRSMPLLMMIFWVYYAFPALTGILLTPFWTILITLVVYQAAYLSEVIRAAILAIPKGQLEASQALGLKTYPTNFIIILPQALRNAIPGIVNQLIIVIKETSLGYILAFNELTYAASQLNSILLVRPLEVFGILACLYFIICFSLSQASAWLERRQKNQTGTANG